jgi:protein-tyrosine phosphatase
MVCLGNICRSPLAEGILKSKVDSQLIKVDSAGTSATLEGELPDPRSIEVAQNNNIDITDQRSRPFRKSDFSEFDFIYVMDQENYQNVLKLSPSEEARKKVSLILNSLSPETNAEVPDPYYGGSSGFKNVFEMLDKACEQIAKELKENADA